MIANSANAMLAGLQALADRNRCHVAVIYEPCESPEPVFMFELCGPGIFVKSQEPLRDAWEVILSSDRVAGMGISIEDPILRPLLKKPNNVEATLLIVAMLLAFLNEIADQESDHSMLAMARKSVHHFGGF